MSLHACPIVKCSTTDELGNPTLITTPLCQHHRDRVHTTLRGLPRTYVETNLALVPGSSMGGEHVTTTKTPPLPLNSRARELQQDTLHVLTIAEAMLRTHHGWAPAPRRGREGPTLQAAAQLLAQHLDTVLALEHGPDFAQAILDLRRRAEALLGSTAPPVKLWTPCPACGCLGLRRRAGSEDADCTACGAVLDPNTYDALTHLAAQEHAA